MRDEQRERHQQRGDRQPRQRHLALKRRETRGEAQQGRPDQRPEHDQKGERQQGDRADQNVGDRFQPQQPPGPRLHHSIGAIEADPQRLDRARREIKRENGADGQQAAARRGQDAVHFVDDGIGDDRRPGAEDQLRRLVGKALRAEKPRKRGQENQEWKERGQSRKRDMAGDRPSRPPRRISNRRREKWRMSRASRATPVP